MGRLTNIKPMVGKPNRDRTPRAKTAARGYGGKWQRERITFLSAHPLCRMCEAKGRITPAKVVDHIEPHKGDRSLFWDRKNWQPLCEPCHNRDKQRIEKGGAPKPEIGIDGWPIEA